MMPDLLLCDLDGTLAVKWKPDILPGRVDELARVGLPVAVVTNQGGVHARYAWQVRGETERAEEYPTVEEIQERIVALSEVVPQVRRAYVALYVGHDGYPLPADREDVIITLSTGVHFHASWRPSWRKPSAGMLHRACCDFAVAPDSTLMLGDSDDDLNAAARLDIPFRRVDEAHWEPGFLDGERWLATGQADGEGRSLGRA
jgi:histidinol phosphatase-like enzyme